MERRRQPVRPDRRRVLAAGTTAIALLAASRPLLSSTTPESKAAPVEGTTGVGPAVFFEQRLAMTLLPAAAEASEPEANAIRVLGTLGYARRIGRWRLAKQTTPAVTVALFVSAQYGSAPPQDGVGPDAPRVARYTDYDLRDPTVAALVPLGDPDAQPILFRHRHWDALHRFAPVAPKQELASMLLPVRTKFSPQSWESTQLFERGVTEYFSALGEVNVRAVRHYRRLRLKNIHGQPIYDKFND